MTDRIMYEVVGAKGNIYCRTLDYNVAASVISKLKLYSKGWYVMQAVVTDIEPPRIAWVFHIKEPQCIDVYAYPKASDVPHSKFTPEHYVIETLTFEEACAILKEEYGVEYVHKGVL